MNEKFLLFKIIILIIAIFSLAMQSDIKKSKTTSHFRIRYEKSINDEEINYISTVVESVYSRYTRMFEVSLNRMTEVFIYQTPGRYRLESQSKLFEDGYYRAGRLYLVVSRNEIDREKLKYIIARIVVRMILEQIPSCPEWLAVGYSLVVGRDLESFGTPARVTVSQFSDLGEDYNRSITKTQLKELYSKIAVTMKFFLIRYGDHAVELMLKKFKTEDSINEVFEMSFNEKIEAIEKAWVDYLDSVAQGR